MRKKKTHDITLLPHKPSPALPKKNTSLHSMHSSEKPTPTLRHDTNIWMTHSPPFFSSSPLLGPQRQTPFFCSFLLAISKPKGNLSDCDFFPGTGQDPISRMESSRRFHWMGGYGICAFCVSILRCNFRCSSFAHLFSFRGCHGPEKLQRAPCHF